MSIYRPPRLYSTPRRKPRVRGVRRTVTGRRIVTAGIAQSGKAASGGTGYTSGGTGGTGTGGTPPQTTSPTTRRPPVNPLKPPPNLYTRRSPNSAVTWPVAPQDRNKIRLLGDHTQDFLRQSTAHFRRTGKPLRIDDFLRNRRPARVWEPPATSRPTSGNDPTKPDWLAGPLSEDQAQTRVNAAAGQRFDPLFRQIEGEERSSGVQQRRIADWYDQYKQDVASSNLAQAAGYQQAQQNVAGLAQASTAMDAAQRAQIQQEMAKDAALRGQTVSPDTAQRASDASGARSSLSSSFGSMLAAQMAAAGTEGAGRYQAGGASQLRARENESGRLRGLETNRRDLLREQGQYKVTAMEELRQGERKVLMGQLQAEMDFKNDQLALAIASSDKEAERKLKLDLAKLSAANERLIEQMRADTELATSPGLTDDPDDPNTHPPRAPSTAQPRDNRGRTPAQARVEADKRRQRGQTAYDKAWGLAQNYLLNPGNARRIVDGLAGKGIPRTVAWAVVQRRLYGGARRNVRDAMRREFGINVKVSTRAFRGITGGGDVG